MNATGAGEPCFLCMIAPYAALHSQPYARQLVACAFGGAQLGAGLGEVVVRGLLGAQLPAQLGEFGGEVGGLRAGGVAFAGGGG